MTFVPPPPRETLKWISVDFDGTLCNTGGAPDYEMGPPIRANTWQTFVLRELGYKIAVYTARPWSEFEAVEAWLAHYRIDVDRIECGKLLTLAHFDDRAWNASDDDWLVRVRQNERPDRCAAAARCDVDEWRVQNAGRILRDPEVTAFQFDR